MADSYNPPQDYGFDQTTDYGRHFRTQDRIATLPSVRQQLRDIQMEKPSMDIKPRKERDA